MSDDKKKRLSYWYFGGLASAGAACCTHPLDLLKVTLQTQQEGKISLLQLTGKVVRTQGVLALYNGLSASLLRQLTYSTTRFGIYEVGKQAMGSDSGFLGKALLAGAAGAAGGFVGTPADMVNVRMQNDIKLPLEQRRNYKNAVDGLFRVYREEGFARLFSGASTATSRAVFMTIGQLSFYDLVKELLLTSGYFGDNLTTHFLSSLTAGAIATTLTQPLDVLKTRAMNAKPGEFNGVWDIVRFTARLGPLGFFKGYVPAFVRLGPHTILTFVFLEQLRMNFGYLKPEAKKATNYGVSAAVLRQLTYSTTRFAIYEVGKQSEVFKDTGFLGRVVMAAIGGTVGGFVGSPADLINVRMQNDVKRPPAQRRNYKNAIDGIVRVWREEGFRRLFSGASSATARSVFMTIGQLTFYDQAKLTLFETGHFTDNIGTHFLASVIAGGIATTMTQPIDVVKTIMMNSKPGEFTGIGAILRHIGKLGPIGFFKGFVPRFIRLGPHTVLTFIFLEQLRINFGVLKPQ
uniref:Mitochondrial dicarboxylate carrier n=1 Tax=Anopheles dirus TaxID=7168 RepID=A0A182N6L3_9DIPT